MIEGSEENIVHFEWNEDYQDFTNRFEAWVELRDIKMDSIQDLYDELSDWLGITKRGKKLPTQTQMDFFSEYYKQPYYDISSYEREVEAERVGAPMYEYRTGSLYNEGTREFRRKSEKGYEYHIAEEKMFHFKHGDYIILRDARTKRILAYHKDISGKYLGSPV